MAAVPPAAMIAFTEHCIGVVDGCVLGDPDQIGHQRQTGKWLEGKLCRQGMRLRSGECVIAEEGVIVEFEILIGVGDVSPRPVVETGGKTDFNTSAAGFIGVAITLSG